MLGESDVTAGINIWDYQIIKNHHPVMNDIELKCLWCWKVVGRRQRASQKLMRNQ